MSDYDPVSLKILWDRLVAIADELVLSLVRTSFSMNVREGYDLSCMIFDARGRLLTQGSYSVPSFTGTAPQTMAHMLRVFPPDTLRPGDVIMTNDPWIGTGHLFDINVMRPVFRGEELVGFTMSVTHLPDIGGKGMASDCTEIYHEGLRLPVCKLADAGVLNSLLLDLIRINVRVPEQTVGDLMANVACNEVGGRALLEFMDEYGLDEIQSLSDAVNASAESAMRERIEAIPDGVYHNAIDIEGPGRPIRLAATLTLRGSDVHIDFAGTDGPVRASINVPMCYTRAQANYVIKCLTIPALPNNEGAMRPITIAAPDDCILNAQPPWPTGGRHSVGHFVVPLLMGALAQALPDKVQADSAMMNVFSVKGRHSNGEEVSSLFFLAGGLGAMQGLDGRAVTPAPSNMTVVPTEVWENRTSMTIEKRELLADTGGAGRWRGGPGQEVVLRNDSIHPFEIALMGQRTEFPALGLAGGGSGSLRSYELNGEPVDPKARIELKPGDRLRMREAGGGGYGDPAERDPKALLDDRARGHVSG
ncbi:MAG: hydantoinase B/oxoprolinase family protein [Gammaproteobacteria bacterium]|nr:hydantoinase B/oxoprolinase family protein [Gammaproteobacteria bacterium]